jgi:tetratricopeptide (TPR) repeat protein
MQNNNTAKLTKSSEQSFEELYAHKEYKAAINHLLQNKQQFSSGIFHYNLGTCYSKLADYGTARYHFEKAIKAGLYNSAISNNLKFVKANLDVDDLSTSTHLPDQFMDLSLSIPREAYYTTSLVFILLLALAMRFKKVTRKTIAVICLMFALVPIFYAQFYLNTVNSAVALKDISLLEGPSKIFQEKGKLRAGSKIILGEYKDGWFLVKYPESLSGWISKDQLGIY